MAQETQAWTLDELAARVERALAAGYPGAPNGRTQAVPDQRAIRWYATIGLVDRPSGMRGRIALYNERHLLQLVAIKRRQAAGAKLAEIQAELAGAGPAKLRRIADLPDPRDRFWAQPAPAAALASPRRSLPATDVSEPKVVRLADGVLLVLDGPPAAHGLGAATLCRVAEPLLAALGVTGVPKHSELTALPAALDQPDPEEQP